MIPLIYKGFGHLNLNSIFFTPIKLFFNSGQLSVFLFASAYAYYCYMEDCYNNYREPVSAMNKLSSLSVPFSFSHKKLDGTTVVIRKARLEVQPKETKDKYAKYKLWYTNLETNEYRSFYIPCLLSVNGKLIDVSK